MSSSAVENDLKTILSLSSSGHPDQLLGFPARDPHGPPIPGRDGARPDAEPPS